MKITSNTLIKNEDKWIWYALTSVLNFVDEALVWDTGSTDHTVDIVKSIKSPKIKLKIVPANAPDLITKRRQEMWDQTKADWILILDGDEIWTPKALEQSASFIRNSTHPYIVNKFINLIGDVYHYQPEDAGRYQIGSRRGHLTIRFYNKRQLPGARFFRSFPDEGIRLPSGVWVQDYLPQQAPYVGEPYLHCTFLNRTSLPRPFTISRSHKIKCELGKKLNSDFAYPPCFYFPRPPNVSSPWEKRSWLYILNSLWQTPLKHVKRRLF